MQRVRGSSPLSSTEFSQVRGGSDPRWRLREEAEFASRSLSGGHDHRIEAPGNAPFESFLCLLRGREWQVRFGTHGDALALMETVSCAWGQCRAHSGSVV